MSFKRDGDDSAWLNLLKKRRIDELFADNIPKDEVLLTSNGRFACMVCHNKPIFDTVEVLVVHRRGKKHLAAQQGSKEKQSQLHYRPNSKRIKQTFLPKTNYDHRTSSRANQKASVSDEDLIKTREELLRINKSLEEHTLNLKPYESKCKISSKYLLPKSNVNLQLHIENPPLTSTSATFKKKPELMNSETCAKTENLVSSCVQTELKPFTPRWTDEQKGLFLRTLENGWKRTSSGKWVRDENAEFDSDEEPPRF